MSAYSSFFRIKKESTTKHPKENFLNLKENLEEKRDLELRAEGSPREKVLTIRSRNCRSSCLQLFSKIGVLKIFAIFREKHLCCRSLLQAATLLKRDSKRSYFPVNITKFLRTAFSIDTPWWLLLELRHISL